MIFRKASAVLVGVLILSQGVSFPVAARGMEATAIGKSGFRVPTSKKSSIISDKSKYIGNEIVVRYSADADDSKKQSLAEKGHLEKGKTLPGGKTVVFRIKDGKSVKNKIAELISDPAVAFVQPNYQYRPLAISSNDTLKTNLWHLDNTGQTVNNQTGTADADIDAPEAWSVNEGTNGSVIVAVLDTGVGYNHPDLLANMWDGSSCVDEYENTIPGGCLHGYDFATNDNNPLPDAYDHGTHVAGIIAAVKNNAKGTIGVAPNAKIMALKTSFTTDELVRAISFAQANGAKIINASFGGYGDDAVLDLAINNFGGLFIAAAGNESLDMDNLVVGGGGPMYPCALDGEGYSNVVCVAATDSSDILAGFSNYGASFVSVAAPGVNIQSTVPYATAGTLETFNGVTPPGIPAGWVKTGNFGSVDDGGKKLVGDTNRSPYLDNAANMILSPAYNLTGSADGVSYVDFDTVCDTEYLASGWTDYMDLESSTDGGVSWGGGGISPDLRWDEEVIDNDTDPTGSASLSIENTSLSAPASSTVRLRFKWTTNSNADANHSGCTIDNVRVKYMDDGAGDSYAYMDGTSMAAPVVSGVAALTWGYRPSLDRSVIREAIVNQGDAIGALSGKVTSGKRVNAKKALDYVTSAKTIVDFGFQGTGTSTLVDDGLGTVAITVPFGTDVTALTPLIIHSGNSISPADGVVHNFSSPVVYTVTALDASTKAYTVTVSVATELKISKFSLQEVKSVAVIGANNIAVTVPYGTNLTSLTPIITHTGSSLTPHSGVAQNFTSPVEYSVEGTFTKDYTVTLTVEANPFSKSGVSFGKGVDLGRTSEDSVKIHFNDVGNAVSYRVSKGDDFAGVEWQNISGGVQLNVKKKNGKQHYFFQFMSAAGTVSETFEKSISYEPDSRVIKNSSKTVKQWETFTQSGKQFTKNNSVKVYDVLDSGRTGFTTVKTDDKGAFSVSFKVNKQPGTYSWYAVDGKTGKKSKTLKYKVVE